MLKSELVNWKEVLKSKMNLVQRYKEAENMKRQCNINDNVKWFHVHIVNKCRIPVPKLLLKGKSSFQETMIKVRITTEGKIN